MIIGSPYLYRKIIPMRTSAFLLPLLLLLSLPAFAQYDSGPHSPKPAGAYYVLAPNGLNLRADARADGKKLAALPYGAPVELLEAAAAPDMQVDQLPGGMAKVNHAGTIGYAFDGYLSRFPAPTPGQEVAAYVEAIRSAGLEVYYESILRDWGGYLQQETALTLAGEAWEEAFLIAKQLYRIPEKLRFPPPSQETEVIFANPDKEEYAWTDEMTVTRKADGSLQSIHYGYRSEGGGKHVSIEYDAEERGLRISEVQIAD